MSSSVATRQRAVAPVSGGVVAAVAVAGAVVAGGLLAARPALGAAILGAAFYLPLVMSSVAIGIAVWIPVLFVKTIPGLAATYMLLLICAAWAGSLVARPATVQQLLPAQRFLVGALALLLAWLSLSVMWADDQGLAWADLRAWFFAAAVLIVVATTITSPGRIRLILLAFAFGAVLSVVVGWLGGGPHVSVASIDPAARVPKRFGGAEGDPNYLAMQLVPAIVLAAALVGDRGRAIVRWGLAACVAVLAIGLASTQSRGGLLAAAVVALLAIPVYGRRWPHTLLVALPLALTVAGAWLAFSGPASRQSSRGAGRSPPSSQAPRHSLRIDDSGNGRSTLWRVAWRVAKAEPVQGVGLNNFRAVAPGYVGQPGSLRNVEKITDRPHVVHNTYLQLLAETGVVGLGLFLAVVIACLAAAWRAARAFDRLGQVHLALLSRAVLLACVGGLAAQVFVSAGSELRLWLLLALGPALLTIAKRPLTSTRP